MDSNFDVNVIAGSVELAGQLDIPPNAAGIVVFAHGSGSSRFSLRNQLVAHTLRSAGIATLLFDLLTTHEEEADERTRHLRFDIQLLATRLVGVTDWLSQNPATRKLTAGYFGASTGAAAALVAAADRSDIIRAVVSRGGRPDLASASLRQVKAPTLLIVGGDDLAVIRLNQQALAQLNCEKKLEIIPGATHLFEESGALECVAQLALEWFSHHLTAIQD